MWSSKTNNVNETVFSFPLKVPNKKQRKKEEYRRMKVHWFYVLSDALFAVSLLQFSVEQTILTALYCCCPTHLFCFLGGRGNAKGFSKENKRRSGKTGAKKGRGNVWESINISPRLCWSETLYCCHVFELATTSHYSFIYQDRKKKPPVKIHNKSLKS